MSSMSSMAHEPAHSGAEPVQTTAMVPHALPSPAELEAEIALATGPTRAVQHVAAGVMGTAAVGFGAFTGLTLWFFIDAGAKSAALVVMGAVYVAILSGVTTLLARAAWKTERHKPDAT